MLKSFNNCYLAEYIFSSNYHQPESEAVSFAEKFLSNRLSDLLKNGFENKQTVENVEIPSDEVCEEEENCPCEFLSYNYHFLIILDKKYKAKLNADKAYILKLLSNKNFLSAFQKYNIMADKEISQFRDDEFALEKGIANFYDLLAEYKIPNKYQYIIESLLESTPEQILNNLDDFVVSHTTYKNYYNKLVYFVNFEDHLNPEFNHSTIKTEYGEFTDKTDIKDSLVMVNYFQNKYQTNKQSRPKFAVDKYYQLMKLDKEKPDLTDCEKADIVLNSDMDLATDKLPTPLEDKRKIAIIRTMRARTKRYLKPQWHLGD